MTRAQTSTWTTTLADQSTIQTHVLVDRDPSSVDVVRVTVTLPDGSQQRANGRVVRRTNGLATTVGWKVESLTGEVSEGHRTLIGAAEAYGSRVARIKVDQWRRERGLSPA